MAVCPNCKCKIGRSTGNKKKLHNGTFIHKRCPGTPKTRIPKVKVPVRYEHHIAFKRRMKTT